MTARIQPAVALERARELMSYDPASGVFAWLKPRPGGKPDAGTVNTRGYRFIKIDGNFIRAHRLAWLFVHGRWPIGDIDHVNGKTADNRIANLRECTKSQNHGNRKRPSTNSSGFKGVRRRKNRWVATIQAGGRNKALGSFLTPEAAHAAYCSAAQLIFGEFARTA